MDSKNTHESYCDPDDDDYEEAKTEAIKKYKNGLVSKWKTQSQRSTYILMMLNR